MRKLIIAFLLLSGQAFCQPLHFKNADSIPDASFRGLSVIDDHVAWVSGTKGWVGETTNGGDSWDFKKVPGYEKCDFRSLYAFDSKTAIIANAGVPAVILRTTDGGKSWATVYNNTDTSAFFDGIDFWNNKEGITYGDPLKGRMMILKTEDGGQTWVELPEASRPPLADGEASFAASGTTIRCAGQSKVTIATGGKVSELFVSDDKGVTWRKIKTPIIQGLSTTGVFSCAFSGDNTGLIVGGDYKRDTLKKDHVFYTGDGGKTWTAPAKSTGGYRECVEYLSSSLVIATGPGGIDISRDGGKNWQLLPDEKGFHVVRKSRKGGLILLAGNGKINSMHLKQ